MRRSITIGLLCGAFTAVWTWPALAQTRASGRPIEIRGFVDVGEQSFAATDTFDAILGDSRGTFVGGGGQVRWRQIVFEVSASRFTDTGERAFVNAGRVFRLGIPTTITLTPIEFRGTYRLPRLWRLTPYAGGGAGQQRYQETSPFADAAENLRVTHTSYHLVFGGETRVWRWVSAAAEVRYRRVPDAIGEGGVSREFNEKDLGGTSVGVRILVGR